MCAERRDDEPTPKPRSPARGSDAAGSDQVVSGQDSDQLATAPSGDAAASDAKGPTPDDVSWRSAGSVWNEDTRTWGSDYPPALSGVPVSGSGAKTPTDRGVIASPRRSPILTQTTAPPPAPERPPPKPPPKPSPPREPGPRPHRTREPVRAATSAIDLPTETAQEATARGLGRRPTAPEWLHADDYASLPGSTSARTNLPPLSTDEEPTLAQRAESPELDEDLRAQVPVDPYYGAGTMPDDPDVRPNHAFEQMVGIPRDEPRTAGKRRRVRRHADEGSADSHPAQPLADLDGMFGRAPLIADARPRRPRSPWLHAGLVANADARQVDPEDDDHQDPPVRARTMIVIGGGRGGVGKTLLAVNLAVYLAQLGRHVVLGDATSGGSNMHTMLGIETAPLTPKRRGGEKTAPLLLETSIPGLAVLPAIYNRKTLTPERASRRGHWLKPISMVNADYVVVNIGSECTPAALDLFSQATMSICVTAPEPPAVEATYRFCRALFVRALRRRLLQERPRLRVLDRALASLPVLPSPRALVAALAKLDDSVATIAAQTLRGVRARLVVGKTRLRQDLDLGPAMVAMADRYLGLQLDYLGFIEQDDAVWLTARRRRPLLIDSPTSKAARNLEKVARRLLAVLAQAPKAAPVSPTVTAADLNRPLTHYDLLGIDRSATDDEIRRAFKLQRRVFNEASLPLTSLVSDAALKGEQARISEAYDTLLDRQRRRTYDLSVFPDDVVANEPETKEKSSAFEAELLQLQTELAREITSETQFSGALLKRARDARGITIEEIANITKISSMHLRSIEQEAFDQLPASVYVRGFLQQVARTLHLDPSQVTRTYLRRIRSARGDFDKGT